MSRLSIAIRAFVPRLRAGYNWIALRAERANIASHLVSNSWPKHLPIFNLKLNIPAGARESETTATPFFGPGLPHAGTLYALSPHMHFRGKRMRFDVIYPDNTRETLLSVPNYDFRWQATYQLAEPKKIPAGSKIVVSGAFDNSKLNRYNPDPGSNVQWGEQSWEEMFIGYFDFTQDD